MPWEVERVYVDGTITVESGEGWCGDGGGGSLKRTAQEKGGTALWPNRAQEVEDRNEWRMRRADLMVR